MNKKVLLTLLLMVSLFMSSCSSKDDDCTKTLEVPHYALENNKFTHYFVMEEVACDFVAPEDTGPPELKNFTYEILYFTFTPDTGNNTSSLKFEIKLNNPNNYAVEGLAFLTIRPAGDNFEYTGNYSELASVPCYKILGNSSCTLTYNQDYPYNPDVGAPESMELVSVKYYIAN